MIDKTSYKVTKDYGKMEVKLKEYLSSRKIKRNALASATNTQFQVIDRWCKGQIDRMDLDLLARICFVLNCEVSDLLVYIPPEPPKTANQ